MNFAAEMNEIICDKFLLNKGEIYCEKNVRLRYIDFDRLVELTCLSDIQQHMFKNLFFKYKIFFEVNLDAPRSIQQSHLKDLFFKYRIIFDLDLCDYRDFEKTRLKDLLFKFKTFFESRLGVHRQREFKMKKLKMKSFEMPERFKPEIKYNTKKLLRTFLIMCGCYKCVFSFADMVFSISESNIFHDKAHWIK